MEYKKGEQVTCRNVPGVIVSYDKETGYYKVRDIKNKSIMPFVNLSEILPISKEEPSPPLTEPIQLEDHLLDKIIGVEEASKIMRLSSGTVKNMCAAGKLPCKKIGNTWILDKTLLPKPSK